MCENCNLADRIREAAGDIDCIDDRSCESCEDWERSVDRRDAQLQSAIEFLEGLADELDEGDVDCELWAINARRLVRGVQAEIPSLA